MIPKIIHYCWFGESPLPSISIKCIQSWKDQLPDYDLRLWNEGNFDVHSNNYVQEAFAAKKYAFVTDYVRLYALLNFGGIYMDTDVEVLKSFNGLLHLPGFIGLESKHYVNTGVIASEPQNRWVKEQLIHYLGNHFLKTNGKHDLTSNVQTISNNMTTNGLHLDNKYSIYKDCMYIFPKDYFCPKTRSGKIIITSNTYCIHHFAASWHPWYLKVKKFFFNSILGPGITDFLVRSKRILLRTESEV